MSANDDAIDALANTLDALDDHLRTSDATAKRSERNRLGMLHIHAIAAMIIGPLFGVIGKQGMAGGTWATARLIPGAPFTLAVGLFAGGLILAVATWKRALRWEMLGLWILLCWYATISFTFGAAIVLWFHAGMPDGPGKPSTYAPALYAHFVAIMAIHLRTLYRIRRMRRNSA
ncbi:hypothetical protein ACWKSP_26610 [Micromonosporaceae bacterium Da 78-11]